MVLAEDIRDRNGRLLLKTDTKLTEKHLHVFKVWGVLEAEIKGAQEDFASIGMDMEKHPLFHEVEARMKERFSCTDIDHPMTEKLFNLCLKRKLKTISKDDAHD